MPLKRHILPIFAFYPFNDKDIKKVIFGAVLANLVNMHKLIQVPFMVHVLKNVDFTGFAGCRRAGTGDVPLCAVLCNITTNVCLCVQYAQ